uniref:JmjC domain-containing protein n=1 Tax=Strongyloides stercoralis TaxID=6248 RepID=A0AAF5DMA0_STRER
MLGSKFLRPDLYNVNAVDKSNFNFLHTNYFLGFDVNYIKNESCNVPLLFFCQPSTIGIKKDNKVYQNYNVVVDNFFLTTKLNVIVDGKHGTSKMILIDLVKCLYVEYDKRKHVLNSLSMDFTFTRLSRAFFTPNFAKQFDLAIQNWPDILKIAQLHYVKECGAHSEKLAPMTWNYCSMSAKGSFTDFHIDFGSTCVWVSMIFDQKTWWLIPPTSYNIRMFEEYSKDYSCEKQFLGCLVEDCCRITLTAGQSFYLPAGWIHAVLTNEDSLMIGGNFLTVASLETHIKIVESERRLRVESDYKYPYFTELMWYTIAEAVKEISGLNFTNRVIYKSSQFGSSCQYKQLNTYFEKYKTKMQFIMPFLKNNDIETEMKNGSYYKP